MTEQPSLTSASKAIAARTFFCNLTSDQHAVEVYDRVDQHEDADADPSEVAGVPVLDAFETDTLDRVSNLMVGLALDIDGAFVRPEPQEAARILKALVQTFDNESWGATTARGRALNDARRHLGITPQSSNPQQAEAPRPG